MNQSTQSFKHHLRFHPYFHFFAFPLLMISVIACIVNAAMGGAHTHWVLALLAMAVGLIAPMIRLNALTVQDRLIRLEVALRYATLAGEPFDKIASRLSKRQIIALRFASDAELVDLARKAAAEGTTPKEIKRSIKDWRVDDWRL
ncbi:MAG: hypothetical protein K1X53_13470 [Candidatus Sumerlaeaceae bacterium]|nr:hypothetical protein [Candidatus Sumerlaeaceae bacterium]